MQGHGKIASVLFLLICVLDVQDSSGGQPYQAAATSYWKQLVINNLAPKKRLVVNAGEDRTTMPGRIVKLSCLGSSDPDSLTFEWEIDAKPEYSNPMILESSSCFPSFIADQPGEYGISLIAHDQFNRSQTDDVKIIASYDDYPNAIAMLETRGFDNSGDHVTDYFIRLGPVWPPTRVYAPPFVNSASDPIGFHVLIVDNSLNIKLNNSYAINESVNQCAMLGSDLSKNLGENDLVVISTLRVPKNDTDMFAVYCGDNLVATMNDLGASENIKFVNFKSASIDGGIWKGEPYTLIGRKGIGEAKGYEVWGHTQPGSDANQFGYLWKDTEQNFRFIHPYIPFETRSITSSDNGAVEQSMKIGDQTISVPMDPVPDGEGGFHVVTLSRYELPMKVTSNNFYRTNSGTGQEADDEQLQDMVNFLDQVIGSASDSDMVIISSVGSPFKQDLFNYGIATAFRQSAYKLQQQLTWLGGIPGKFSALGPNGAYSIVGIKPGESYDLKYRVPASNYPIESIEASNRDNPSSNMPANIVGLFHKNTRGWYLPQLANGGGTQLGILPEMINILFQDPLSWNNPGSWRGTDDDAYMIAYEIISEEVLSGIPDIPDDRDLRALYYKQGSTIAWSEVRNTIYNLSYDFLLEKLKNNGDARQDYFKEDSFVEAKDDLVEEIDARNRVFSWFFDPPFGLLNLMKDINAEQGADLNNIYNKIVDGFIPADQKGIEVTVKVLKYVGEALKLVSEIIPLLAEPSATDDPGKESKAGPGLGLIGSLLGITSEVIESFGDTTNPTGELKDTVGEIWQNCWDRFFNLELIMQNMFAIIVEDWNKLATVDQKKIYWYDPEEDPGTIYKYLERGFEKNFYQTLLPVVYSMDYMYGVPYATPNDFWWKQGGIKHHRQKIDAPFYQKIDELGENDCGALSSIFTFWENTYEAPCDSSKHGFMDKDDFNCLFTAADKVCTSQDKGTQYGKGYNKNEFFTRWPFAYELPCHWDERNNGGCP